MYHGIHSASYMYNKEIVYLLNRLSTWSYDRGQSPVEWGDFPYIGEEEEEEEGPKALQAQTAPHPVQGPLQGYVLLFEGSDGAPLVPDG